MRRIEPEAGAGGGTCRRNGGSALVLRKIESQYKAFLEDKTIIVETGTRECKFINLP